MFDKCFFFKYFKQCLMFAGKLWPFSFPCVCFYYIINVTAVFFARPQLSRIRLSRWGQLSNPQTLLLHYYIYLRIPIFLF